MAPVPHQQQAPGCKANLYLRITGQREDGYHELESLFLPLQQPSDQIHFEPGAPGSGLTLTCSDPDLATPSNSIRVAYETFRSVSDKAPDLRIHLDKQVPQGAGLGGGSADAACVLQYLHAHVCPGLPEQDLQRLALQVGADVPFFLHRQPCWVSGIGERLEPLPVSFAQWRFLVVCPDVSISTGWAYRIWDEMQSAFQILRQEDLTSPRHAYRQCCSSGALVLYNSFEQAVFPYFPELGKLKQALLAAGMDACVMSGSGSALVGLTRNAMTLESVCSKLEARRVSFYAI
ncbi:4-(cytidine 5'-diphospho)-2-C-methyl-D-erythritol kinase [Desulfohalobium retbaense]|uniref:4-diphosphocytidyl-2-C-methyl-D-erythritol kinase n=1 Tax=Desulfohalobium retbaense (strain ATCC 49708 / DSM 5692 / JCM 16813 / HR100) TaxID=485915 RepID=C8X132_DESRD|nr:4-(cytidine 5'-diphospho)-2-C-methyl-D-erythritol kinase [Desulfohalobium retbaense]ACV68129.1 4-diphosphocytidyl-2C-methyl-D-erythritolkinase [Desulfohalobium retbaense DSM 5692]